MEGKILIKRLRLRNLLSYGPNAEEVTLGPLNVLVGKNASGKSNLIEALGLLQALPTNLPKAIRRGGGVAEWLWKGDRSSPDAQIEAIVSYPEGPSSLRYQIGFSMVGQRLEITEENIDDADQHKPNDGSYFSRNQADGIDVNIPSSGTSPEPLELSSNGRGSEPRVRIGILERDASVYSFLKDAYRYPQITYLGTTFGQIRLYRAFCLGPDTQQRNPQPADLPEDFLEEDATNLGMVLNDLDNKPSVKRQIIERLQEFYTEAEGISTKVVGGTVQIFIHEKGLSQPVPATRLSDGTLRYLCLLTILCHPEPPPLICIEEPELGLHPDILPTIAELLIQASKRTQIIVTTHSDTLVSALSETPESVLVCEHDEAGSHLRRLQAAQLEDWLKKYSLGELWRMGEIGG